jgi:hypothetical protein
MHRDGFYPNGVKTDLSAVPFEPSGMLLKVSIDRSCYLLRARNEVAQSSLVRVRAYVNMFMIFLLARWNAYVPAGGCMARRAH